jgi:hypothetical protein
MPLADDASAAFIFSSRHARQRQPGCASVAGMGMTCGNSAHQQPPSGWQAMGALHWEQRVSTEKLWRDAWLASSARQIGAPGAGGFLVSGAKRMLS